MKIGSLDTKIAPLPPTPERERDSKGPPVVPGGAGSPAAEPSARVELSPAAASSGVSTVAGDGSFDSAKVERIAQAIRDGKFTVNAEVIAEKLIINAEELLGRGKTN